MSYAVTAVRATELLALAALSTKEPAGGAHRHPEAVMASTGEAIGKFLHDFPGNKGKLEIREHRREKFMAIGAGLN